jgi:enediyne biosynthesis protein E4
MNATPSLLVNQVRSANHWVAFRLTGASPATSSASPSPTQAQPQTPRSTRDALGARIKVKVGERILVDEVRSGSSFISNNDMRVHFGLGAATKIDSVEVRWPSGLVENFSKIQVDKFNELKEGAGTAAK